MMGKASSSESGTAERTGGAISVPLTEVAYGVRFVAPQFDVVQFGEYYHLIKDTFPQHRMVVPIATQQATDQINQTIEVPTLPRVWFERGTRLIQLQSDRFIYNWRQVSSKPEEYPGFDVVFGEFRERWEQYLKFAGKAFALPLHIEELSLTYINQIRDVEHLDTPIFTFRAEPASDALPAPELWVSQLRFALAKENAKLTVSARPAIHLATQERMTQLDVVVESIKAPAAEDTPQSYAWFEAAHELVHRGFATLVRKEWRKQWGFVDDNNG
jgi:uncharacterized protein (TIGR04255 family)